MMTCHVPGQSNGWHGVRGCEKGKHVCNKYVISGRDERKERNKKVNGMKCGARGWGKGVNGGE